MNKRIFWMLLWVWFFAALSIARADSLAQRRESDRQAAGNGRITRIEWSEDGRFLCYTHKGKRCRFDLKERRAEVTGEEVKGPDSERRESASRTIERRDSGVGTGRIPPPKRGFQYMTEPSPDGKWNAHCRDWNVVLENCETGETIQVTTEGHRKFRYGTANWVYGEELKVRHGMWWSPDSKKLIFYEFDERPVKDFYLTTNLTEINTDLLVEGYTKAGAPNPKVSLILYDLQASRLTPVDTGDEDQYLYNMRFTPDGSEMLYNRTDRRQRRLDVMALDLETGKTRVVVTEVQKTWQENSPMMRFLRDGRRFIWESETTGWRQYELRHLNGSPICVLTRGEYPASGIVQVDEDREWLYYTAASDEHPLCEQLHRMRLDGTGQKRLTRLPFHHSSFNLSPDGNFFTVQYENVETPPSTALYSTEGELVSVLAEGPPVEKSLSELFSFKANDGVTDLYGILHKPEDFDPQKKYPLIVSVYGGPESRVVRNTYQRGSRYTQQGFLVAQIDNRGTEGRGKAFKDAVYGRLGDVDIQDQADGVRALRQRPYVDGDRVGIVGSSYGGYLAALGVLKHPDVFHAAVVRSAVTDWLHYDSIYTERYMNLPQDNPEGYRRSSCMTYADQSRGKMLILHGMVDDNVHPNNVWQLIDALDRAGKKYESRFFPRAGHGTGGLDTQMDFFQRHLMPAHDADASGKEASPPDG